MRAREEMWEKRGLPGACVGCDSPRCIGMVHQPQTDGLRVVLAFCAECADHVQSAFEAAK